MKRRIAWVGHRPYASGMTARTILRNTCPTFGLVACVLVACGGGSSERDPPLSESETGIEWYDCGELQCAEVMVPVDRNQPDGAQTPIAINRVQPRRSSPYYGVLLFNPGGPGQPGKPLIEANVEAFRTFPFDVIGFDPRGVGDSAAIECSLALDAEAALAEGGAEALISGWARESERCREQAGELYDHLSSNAVVADIEQLRIALEVDRINFYGISYGTRLGALYAQTYPERMRALVLDSPLPPVADLQQLTSAQFDATLVAHEALLVSCREGTLQCPENADELFEQLVQSAEMEGVRAAFLANWSLQLASPLGRDLLLQVLTQVSEATMAMSEGMDAVMDTQPAPELDFLPEDFNGAVNLTVNCADQSVDPLDVVAADASLASFAQRSEVFALRGISALTCSGWQVQRDPTPDIGYSPSQPPLILAGTQDTLTPLEFAEALEPAIDGSVLLRSEHYGHGIFSFGGVCVGEPIGRYLGLLELPEPGTVCPGPE